MSTHNRYNPTVNNLETVTQFSGVNVSTDFTRGGIFRSGGSVIDAMHAYSSLDFSPIGGDPTSQYYTSPAQVHIEPMPSGLLGGDKGLNLTHQGSTGFPGSAGFLAYAGDYGVENYVYSDSRLETIYLSNQNDRASNLGVIVHELLHESSRVDRAAERLARALLEPAGFRLEDLPHEPEGSRPSLRNQLLYATEHVIIATLMDGLVAANRGRISNPNLPSGYIRELEELLSTILGPGANTNSRVSQDAINSVIAAFSSATSGNPSDKFRAQVMAAVNEILGLTGTGKATGLKGAEKSLFNFEKQLLSKTEIRDAKDFLAGNKKTTDAESFVGKESRAAAGKDGAEKASLGIAGGGKNEKTKPIVLDLDGNGLSITELSQSTQFVDGGDGLQHRTAWAGIGDGVLFFDVSGDGQIKERREYVFTEWDPTATSDLDALRSVFDTNGDGKLTSADAGWGSFKVLVTKADGTTEAKTLAQLGITEINLRGDTTRIELPDGSVIAGKSTFTRSDGTTGTVGDMILAMDTQGHRLEQTQSTVNGLVVREIKAYAADGSIDHRIRTESTANGSNLTTYFDDNGDGVTDRVQTITRQFLADRVIETLRNFIGANAATGVLESAKETTTTNSQAVTIKRDSLGGGWWDQIETWAPASGGGQTITITDRAQNGATIRSTMEVVSANGLTRTESFDEDGNGSYDRVVTQVITLNANGTRTEVTTTRNGDGTLRSVVSEAIGADGRSRVISHDRDGNNAFEDVDNLQITVAASGATTSVNEYKNGDGSLRARTVTEQSADTLTKTIRQDLDGDGIVDRTTLEQTVIANGNHTQTVRVTNQDGSIRVHEKTYLAANKVDRQVWVDQNQNGVFEATDLVAQTVFNSTTQEKTETVYDRNPDGSVHAVRVSVTNATGLITNTTIDRDNNGTIDTRINDTTMLNTNGSATRVIETRNSDSSLRSKTTIVTSADGRTQTRSEDINGDGINESVQTRVISNLADGTARTLTQDFAGNGTTLRSQTRVDESADRRVVTTFQDTDGNGTWDLQVTNTQATTGSRSITEASYNPDNSLARQTQTSVSDDGLEATTNRDLNGDGTPEARERTATSLSNDGSRTTVTEVRNGDNSTRSKTQISVSDDGLTRTVREDSNWDGTYERRTTTTTTLNTDGSRNITESTYSSSNALLYSTNTHVTDDGRVTTVSSDRNGDNVADIITTKTVELLAHGASEVTLETRKADGTLLSRQVTRTSDDGRNITTSDDIDGNGTVDRISAVNADNDGTRYVTTTNYDALQNVLSGERKVIFANGMWEAHRVDRNGDGVYEDSVTTTRSYNLDGSLYETIRSEAADASIYKTIFVTKADDGLTVWRDENWDMANGVDRKTVQSSSLSQTGILTETSEVRSQSNALLSREVTVTSADRRVVETNLDLDGNSIADKTTTVAKLNNGFLQTTILNKSTSGAVRSTFVETISDDGLTVERSANLDGVGGNERTSRIETQIAGNGASTTLSVHTTSNTVASGFAAGTTRHQRVSSDDGLHVTNSLDTNGDLIWENIATSTRSFSANGAIVDTTETRNPSNVLLARLETTTSGNGLSQTTSYNIDGVGGNDRVSSRIETATGDVTSTVSDYRANGTLARSETITVTENGRRNVQTFDRDGNAAIDQRVTWSVNADQLATTVIEDLNSNGMMFRKAETTESQNGLIRTSRFDINGDLGLDIVRTSETSYSANGGTITTVTETYGNGRASLVQITTVDADKMGSTTTYDLNGDGTIDATRTSTTTSHSDGRVNTLAEVRYTGGELQSRTTHNVSADGRLVTETFDFDGNSQLDLRIDTRDLDNGEKSVVRTTYNSDGSASSFTKITSADGLVTRTTVSGDQTQTVKTYSPLRDGSYSVVEFVAVPNEWGGGSSNVVVSRIDYSVDAGGTATWTYVGRSPRPNTGETVIAHSNKSVRLTTEQRAEYIEVAQRIYDTVLDRDMYENEIDDLVRFIGRDGLDEERLADSLMGTASFIDRYTLTGTVANFANQYYADVYGRAPTASEIQQVAIQMVPSSDHFTPNGSSTYTVAQATQFVKARDKSLIAAEFDTRYGTQLSNAEFVTQIYQNSFGRSPSLFELSTALTALSSTGGKSRADIAIDLASSAEHIVRGNTHESTNNFDLRANPVQYERTLDRAYAKDVVAQLYLAVNDTTATSTQINTLANLLLTGDKNPDDVVQNLLANTSTQSSSSLHGLTGAALVNRAFLNTLGRAPSTAESQTWAAHLSSGRITVQQFVASIATSVDHEQVGRGSPGADSVTGGAYTDLIYGWGGNDTLRGGGGSDTIYAGIDNDSVFGGDGNDLLSGDEGNDTISGEAGSDTIYGGTGNDVLLGGDGNDRLEGEAGDDNLAGNWGNDMLAGGDGNDTLDGGVGDDTLDGGGNADRMIGWTGNDVFWGRWGNDTVFGGEGNDTIGGHNDNDSLMGEAGDDLIYGDAGDDWLDGGLGADTMIGGAGRDTISGGLDSARDVFVFGNLADSAVGTNRDQVRDFGLEDVIDLSQIDANTSLAEDQAFVFSGMTAAARSVWYAVSGNDLIIRADVDGNTLPDFEILLVARSSMVADDFIL